MRLLIDIPESMYEGVVVDRVLDIRILNEIKNGTPLPKGHGRLIDADALYDEYVKEPEEFNGGHSLMALFRVASTIIEADKRK